MIYIALFLIALFSTPKINCEPELQDALATIEQVNGVDRVFSEVLKDGPISIKRDPQFPFKAYWDSTSRTIGITPMESPFYSLLFELHNASKQKEFDYYDSLARQGKISKKDYILAIEQIEFQNTVQTSALIDQGIQQGLLPKESQTFYSSTWEAHLRDQESGGHSAWIGQIYDALAS